MANLKNGTTWTLPTELTGMCMDAYSTTNISEAIRNALVDFLLLPYDEQILDTFAIHQLLPNVDDRKNLSKTTIRLDDNLFKILMKLSAKQDSLSKTAEQMISRTLYAQQKGRSTSSNTSLLYILGNKRNPKMQAAIRNIKDTAQDVNWQTSVETCAGVLGIYANHKFADTEIVNDNDWNKVNLYRAIQENPRRLIILARTLTVDSATFNTQKNLLKNATESTEINYEAAAAYLYLNINSFRHGGAVLDIKASQAHFHSALTAIAPLHERMVQSTPPSRKTQFQNMDLIKVIKKYRRRENVLFIVDPPYLDTDLYNTRDEKFGEAEHAELAHQLYLAKKKGNDCIFFCRITASKKDQKKPNAEEWDQHMRGRIDDLYYIHGFYYIDVPLDAATTERIITSFPFDGATVYRKECD